MKLATKNILLFIISILILLFCIYRIYRKQHVYLTNKGIINSISHPTFEYWPQMVADFLSRTKEWILSVFPNVGEWMAGSSIKEGFTPNLVNGMFTGNSIGNNSFVYAVSTPTTSPNTPKGWLYYANSGSLVYAKGKNGFFNNDPRKVGHSGSSQHIGFQGGAIQTISQEINLEPGKYNMEVFLLGRPGNLYNRYHSVQFGISSQHMPDILSPAYSNIGNARWTNYTFQFTVTMDYKYRISITSRAPPRVDSTMFLTNVRITKVGTIPADKITYPPGYVDPNKPAPPPTPPSSVPVGDINASMVSVGSGMGMGTGTSAGVSSSNSTVGGGTGVPSIQQPVTALPVSQSPPPPIPSTPIGISSSINEYINGSTGGGGGLQGNVRVGGNVVISPSPAISSQSGGAGAGAQFPANTSISVCPQTPIQTNTYISFSTYDYDNISKYIINNPSIGNNAEIVNRIKQMVELQVQQEKELEEKRIAEENADFKNSANLPLKEYAIKSSYHSAFDGKKVSLDALKQNMLNGNRFIDLQIFMGVDDILYVGYSDEDKTIMIDKTLPLHVALNYISSYAFIKDVKQTIQDSDSPALYQSYTDYPLILNLRFYRQGDNQNVDIIGKLYTEYFKSDGGIFNQSNLLVEGGKAVQVDKTTRMNKLNKKIIISMDINNILKYYTKTNDAMEVANQTKEILEKIVNIKTGGHTWKSFTDYSNVAQMEQYPLFNKDNGYETNTKNLYIIFPSYNNAYNPDILQLMKYYKIQTIPIRYWLGDSGQKQTTALFNFYKMPFVPMRNILIYANQQ